MESRCWSLCRVAANRVHRTNRPSAGRIYLTGWMRLDSYFAHRFRNHLTRQVYLINRAVSMVGTETG